MMPVQYPHTFCVLDDPRRLALHYRHGGVGGTQVNTDDLTLNLLAIALSVFRIAPPEL